MKTLLLIFLSIGSCVPKKFDGNGAAYYRQMACDIHFEVGETLAELRAFQTNVDTNLKNLQLDLNLKTNARISEIKKMVEAKRNKPGIAACRTSLSKGLDALSPALQNLVKKKLTDKSSSLKRMVTKLTKIQKQLSRPAVTKELQDCTRNPSCKIGNEYNAASYDASSYVSKNKPELASKELAKLLIKTYVIPAIPKQIEDLVFKPVNKCLSTIK